MDQAVWQDGRCAWVGAVPVPARSPALAPEGAAALGPDLYGGTSGVALFLAHLHAQTGDRSAHRTAIGAIRHALDRAGEIPPGRALALYTGRLGVALAAARCGRILGDAAVLDSAAALAGLVRDRGVTSGNDLIGGGAGAVAGLLALSVELEDPSFAGRARDLGVHVAAAAGTEPLTGMAHGEAGIAHALLEVAAATGDASARAGALRAVEHEKRLFDAPTGNWPDLRSRPPQEIGDVGAASAMAWCHGAPGVVLSRRRSVALVGDVNGDQIAQGAAVAARWVRAAVATRPGNLSLCHGLAGNAECLWEGTGDAAARSLALDVAGLGTEEFGRNGRPWPCGTPAGETPALMLGLSGIGLFYLRLSDPSVPSVLAIGGATGVMG